MGVAGGSCRAVALALRDCDESFDKIPRVYAAARIEMNVAVFLIFTSQQNSLLQALTRDRRHQVASKKI